MNSPTQSIRRSPPVLPIRMSMPAPPYARSSYVPCVSVVSLSEPFVVRMSSAFMRSLPQPPKRSSLPEPPTSQSLPRSPNMRSLPSVFTVAIRRHVPFGALLTQLGAVSRPSVIRTVVPLTSLLDSTRFRKNSYGNAASNGL